MDAALQVIANADPPHPLPWHLGFLWPTVLLLAVILVGVRVLVWLDRWRKRSDSERLSANDQLANFRKLYDNGQLSPEEFERIRALLAAGQVPEAPKPAEPGSGPA